jgi:hypothetical protein
MSRYTMSRANACGVFLLDGDIVSIAAHDSLTDEWRQEYPRSNADLSFDGVGGEGRTRL